MSDQLNDKKQQNGSGRPNESGSLTDNITVPKIELPKGGGAIRGIEEKFQVNAVNGTAALGIPVPLSPSRQGSTPAIDISYNSGNGNSPFGIGWEMSLPRITRKTNKKLPEYKDEEESDTFIFSGAEDLVPKLTEQMDGSWEKDISEKTESGITYTVSGYRPRIEGSFVRIEKWKNKTTGEVHWRTVSSSNSHSYYGISAESRIADPADETRVFEWLLCKSHDDKGNITLYRYKQEDFVNIPNNQNEKNRISNCTQTYLKTVYYGNKSPWFLGDAEPAADDFLFRAVLDYGEHDTAADIPKTIYTEKNTWPCRKDPFSSYRSGFEIRTYRRCSRILVFHCFDSPDLPHKPYLVKSLQLFYDDELQLTGNGTTLEGFSFLVSARQNGHRWDDASSSYTTKYLPETEFTYQQHEWKTAIEDVSAENTAHAPAGIGNTNYVWVDLFSEGISGILSEHSSGWYYKSNLGNAAFSEGVPVAPKPSFSGLGNGRLSIQELEGNGVKYLAQLENEPRGFFKLSPEEEWEPFRTFESLPNIAGNNRHLRTLDLNGDGIADLLISEENSFRWYEGLGEKGFAVSKNTEKVIDEEKGPAVVFADTEQCIFLSDFSGDGLTDIVRIRNGSVCYWPNLGYGRFGAKVEMDNAPFFDHPDAFNPSLLRLADIDGSGTTDIIYLGKNDFRVWMNQNGNSWSSEPQIITPFPEISRLSDVTVLDFLGSGTACIVYSSSLPAHQSRPLQYIDLMGSKKPGLLIKHLNNCGKETSIEYRSSAFYYLDDKKAGINWITKLPFPVHCVSKIKIEDKIRECILLNTFSYRHGYYDPVEGEFRGFARVEQYDTEDFSLFKLNGSKNVVDETLHQPAMKSISWYHTGAFFDKERILHQCRDEYFRNPSFTEYEMPEPVIDENLSVDEWREALRACKGLVLRTEMYADDDSLFSDYPYSATQTAYTVRRVQPKQENRYGSFQAIPTESISYGYERRPEDPRVNHSFILEVDDLGYVLKTATVVYPRAARPSGSDAIPDKVWDEQNKAHITYCETAYTNDIIEDAVYRLRVSCESKGYEISGIPVTAGVYFEKETLASQIAGATEIRFDQDFGMGVQKRLSGHGLQYFINDSFDGERPLYEQSPLGISYKSYRLAFTSQLVSKYYGTKVTDAMLLDAKYVHREGDEHWWSQSGIQLYPVNPETKFYIPEGEEDLFGNSSSVVYDSYMLLAESATDAIGNTASAENDYRVLSPVMMTDPNLNRTAVETDELGMVVKTALMGKDGAGEGDTLADPTTRLEYDLFNWKNNSKPNYVHTFAREKHGIDNPRWQENYAYSDGSGGVIMAKTQVEPGDALQWNDTTKAVDTIPADPRWLGNGRTILNNKGKIVKQYEPYFSTTHEYENESALVETGFPVLNYYDPVGRTIKTELPNGTFTKIEFDAWKLKSYDVNDTVKDSQWYADRGSPDPAVDPEPVGDEEKRAAWLAAKHYDTPSVSHTDSLGKSFYVTVDYGGGKTTSTYTENDPGKRYAYVFDQLGRKISEGYANILGASMYGKNAEKGERWTFTDAMGRLVKTWDNDLFEMYPSFDALHRPVSMYLKEKGKAEIVINHTVYGDILTDSADRNMKNVPYLLFDQSGMKRIKTMDFKGNPLEMEQQLATDYTANVDWKSLEGLGTIALIEAAAAAKLEKEIFRSSTQVDAIGRATELTLPDNSVFRPTYNIGNQLDKLEVQIRGAGSFVTFLEEQDYDAKGQRQYALLGNGMITNYFYDQKTFRLINLLTKQPGAADTDSIQNLNYIFDPAGNVTFTEDKAQQTYFFKNAVVKPESSFSYDALYQLISASGREHAGTGSGQPVDSDLPYNPAIPHINDAAAVREYTETYEYDDCGNIKLFDHKASGGNWKRFYHYEYEDDPANLTNRLKKNSAPGDPEAGPYTAAYTYDTHGNMQSMPHLASLSWNFSDHLRQVDLGGGGTAYYVYGNGGGRVRKIIDRGGGLIQERIYLGAVEIFRQYQGTDKRLERNTLHIADNTGRIAQVDTKLIDTHGLDPDNPLGTDVIRYQYGNHIGSATLETNESGDVISYEEYHPFGTSAYRSAKSGTNLSLKRYRFSGKERDDETGLYYFGARYLAAWLGRWTSSDPAGFADGLNLYQYCLNNPVTLTDPNGMQTAWQAPPPVAFTPGEQGRRDTIDFINTHYVIAVENGRVLRVRVNITDADWVTAANGSFWQGRLTDRSQVMSVTDIGPYDSNHPPENSFEPIESTPPPAPPPAAPPSVAAPPGGDPGGTRTEGPPGGSPGGTRTEGPPGSGGSGSPPPEDRSWWSRGGRTLLIGLGLVALGALTLATGGGALIVATGVMTIGAGAIMAGGSAGLMAASYSGYTTAEDDARVMGYLDDVGIVGSTPFGAVGGAIGYAVGGRRGMRIGGMIGGITQGIYTIGQAGLRGLAATGGKAPYTFGATGTALGTTDAAGNIVIQNGLSGTQLTQTVIHEGVHRFFTPLGTGSVATLRQSIGMWGYQNSHLLRFLEEGLAQSAATGSYATGFRWISSFSGTGLYNNLSLWRVFGEGALYVGGTGAAAYGANWAINGR